MSWVGRNLGLPPRKKPIRRVSLKRRREAKQRRAVLAEVGARDGVGCWAQHVWSHDCAGPLDGHELRPRAHYPGGHLDPENVRLICRTAHTWVHDHPIKALELGLLRSTRIGWRR